MKMNSMFKTISKEATRAALALLLVVTATINVGCCGEEEESDVNMSTQRGSLPGGSTQSVESVNDYRDVVEQMKNARKEHQVGREKSCENFAIVPAMAGGAAVGAGIAGIVASETDGGLAGASKIVSMYTPPQPANVTAGIVGNEGAKSTLSTLVPTLTLDSTTNVNYEAFAAKMVALKSQTTLAGAWKTANTTLTEVKDQVTAELKTLIDGVSLVKGGGQLSLAKLQALESKITLLAAAANGTDLSASTVTDLTTAWDNLIDPTTFVSVPNSGGVEHLKNAIDGITGNIVDIKNQSVNSGMGAKAAVGNPDAVLGLGAGIGAAVGLGAWLGYKLFKIYKRTKMLAADNAEE